METRILYVNAVKTTYVLFAISVFEKWFSGVAVTSGFTENVLG